MISDLFKSLVWDALVNAAIKKLFAALPAWATWGPLGPFITHWLTKFLDNLYVELAEWIDVKEILFKNKLLEKEFVRHYVILKSVAKQFGENSDEFKKERLESQKHFFAFVQPGNPK